MRLTKEQENIIQALQSPSTNFVKIDAVSGSGKAQPLSEKVLTPHGWKTMGDIKKNDYVIGSSGQRTKVLEVYPQGIRKIYKVSFIDGTSVNCDEDHLWTVHRNRYKETITVKEMMNTWIEKKRLDKRYNTYSSQFNYSIDIANPIEYENKNNKLLIHPYLLGLLIGDGGINRQVVAFTNSSKDLIKRVEELLPIQDELKLNQKITYRIVSKEKWKKSQTKIALMHYNLDGKLSSEKHIPKEYLYADIESRKQLLQGLIDTDGYVKNGQLVEYSTSSKQLADDFLELARSLGMIVSCKERIPNYTYKNKKLIGKKNYRIRHLISKKKKSIVSIEYSHDEEAQCIKVDADDSLYVTNGFNLTHNTSSLIAVAKALNVKRGLYISYNKAIAEEAASKFPFGVQCKTIHSLAYWFTVKQFPLKLVPSLKSKIIKEKIDPIRKSFLIEVLTKYFLSRHTIIKDFVDEFYPNLLSEKEVDLLREYFVKMKDGLCECSHDFYLKLFHILLHHRIVKMTEFDFLALDEAGDVNGASLEIFRLIPAKKRIMVGDKQQNIYSFNQTINGFNALSQEGRLLSLSQSFRVSDQISPYVENFCRKFLDKNMVFKGVKYQEPVKQSEATFFYISRTNAGVVKRMIELDEMNIKYNLTRPVKTLFALPLLLLRIKKDPSHEITLPEYAFLKEDMEKYVNNQKLQDNFPNPISYIEDLHSDDISIVTAANLIKRFSPQGIVTAYNNALEHEKHPETHKVTVTSAHSSKGLESTVVYIEDDLNKALTITIEKFNDAVHEKIVKDKEVLGNAFNPKDKKYELFDIENPNMELLNNKQIEEFRLYYVAVTRAMLQVHNAEWLEEPEISTTFSLITNRGDFE